MAFFNQTNILDEDQQNQQAGQAGAPNTLAIGGPQSAEMAGTSGAGAAQSGQAPSSTNFTNIDRYVTQNQANTRDLTDTVSGNIRNTVGQADSALNQAPQQIDNYFNTQVPQGGEDLINQLRGDVVGFAQNQENIDQFNELQNADYRGYDSFGSSSFSQPIRDYISGAQQFEDVVDNTQTRKRALEGVQQNNRAGITAFNNLLLQNDPNSRQALADASAPISELDSRYSETADLFNQGIDATRGRAQGYRDLIDQTFYGDGGIIPSAREDLDTRLSSVQSDAQRQDAQIRDALNSGRALTREQLRLLGLNESQWRDIVKQNEALNLGSVRTGTKNQPGETINFDGRLDLADFLRTQDASTFNSDYVANEDDIALQNALEMLLGPDSDARLVNTDAQGLTLEDIFRFDKDAFYSALKDEDVSKLRADMDAALSGPRGARPAYSRSDWANIRS